jgi:hypothetical protein
VVRIRAELILSTSTGGLPMSAAVHSADVGSGNTQYIHPVSPTGEVHYQLFAWISTPGVDQERSAAAPGQRQSISTDVAGTSYPGDGMAEVFRADLERLMGHAR